MQLLAAGNWKVWIARYNLQARRFSTIDARFLLDMPPRVLPELLAWQRVLAQAPRLVAAGEYGGYQQISLPPAQARLRTRLTEFQAHYQQHPDWQSRTVSEWLAYRTIAKQLAK